MAEPNPGFGETNAPERAGGIVRDHVRAVIESAEGNAAEIRRRAREDADALDQERAESASRLTTQLGELEGSFTSFGEQLGKELEPSGEIKGELGSGGGRAAAGAAAPGRSANPSAWRSTPAPTGTTGEQADRDEGEGLIGGLRKRFTPSDATDEGEAPPSATTGPTDWLPGESDQSSTQKPAPETGPEGAPGDSGDEWVVREPETADTEGSKAEPEPEPELERKAEENPAPPDPPSVETAPGGAGGPPTADPPPRGRIARLLLGRRPGD